MYTRVFEINGLFRKKSALKYETIFFFSLAKSINSAGDINVLQMQSIGSKFQVSFTVLVGNEKCSGGRKCAKQRRAESVVKRRQSMLPDNVAQHSMHWNA